MIRCRELNPLGLILSLLIGLLCANVSLGEARANEPTEPEEPSYLNRVGLVDLPPLSHRGIALGFEYTIAHAQPTEVSTAAPIEGARAFGYSARALLEAPIVARRWYVGASYSFAAASVPSSENPGSGGSSVVSGNPEIWGRGLWSSRAGLSAGGGLGLVIPVPRSFTTTQRAVVRAIRVVRPWDYAHFQDLQLTARPFFDIRYVIGPITLQMRQGIDISIMLRDPQSSENHYDTTAITASYIGVQTVEWVTLGLAVQEVYQITKDVSSAQCPAPCDGHRAQLTLSPSIQLQLRPIAPSLSAILPVSTPLGAEVSSYYAARVHLNGTILLGE